VPISVFVVDSHGIYRRGLTSCLRGSSEITAVAEAGSVREAWQNPVLAEADVTVVDPDDLPGAVEFIRQVAEATGSQVLICSARCKEHDVLACVQAGAVGYLAKDTLTPEALTAAAHAAAQGAGVMTPELLGTLLRGISRVSREVLEPRGVSLSPLSAREQEVLRLVADGFPIREVALRMSYSERTIKNVLHDVVIKLNVRTRSQAVALAAREGLI
jgi:DNA-binding NarL/FixJ family response regulator